MEYNIQTSGQLGKALQSERKIKKLTQNQVAQKAGMLAKTISLLERSPDKSSVNSLFKLLSVLEMELVVRPKSTMQINSEW